MATSGKNGNQDAIQFAPPGDWTLSFGCDGAGRVSGATVGCWLARGLAYARVA